MKKNLSLLSLLFVLGASLVGCGDAGEAVSDKPAGDLTPSAGGAKEGGNGAAEAPAPSPGPQ